MSPDSDIVISGHTHDQSVSMKNGVLYLNPGEVCARNKPVSEALLLEILDEQFNVTTLQRAIKSDHWDTHEQTFTRLSREQSA
jgi:predicted phosphodiesterase